MQQQEMMEGEEEALEDGLSEKDLALIEKMEEERKSRLHSLAATLSGKRKKAIEHRYLSGIEDEWDECEDAHEGIDNANRNTEKLVKPRTMSGRVTVERQGGSNGSNLYLGITAKYVEGFSARISDIVNPMDDRNFTIDHSPIPEIEGMKKSTDLVQVQSPAGVQTVPAKDYAQQQLDEAKKRAEKAQTRIDDWMEECNIHAEVRKVTDSLSLYGTGVLKGPIPTVKRRRTSSVRDGAMVMEMVEEIIPASKAVNIRNFYPDPACGEDIHNGSFVFESDSWSAKQLRECMDSPEHLGYLHDEIMAVLEEGPGKRNMETHTRKIVEDDERFEVWYFYGDVSAEDVESAGCECKAYTTETIPVVITMVNDRVIKAAVSHLESGEFPYDVWVMRRRADFWAGIGIAKQIMPAQKELNGANRNMLDNASLSGGPQIVLDDEAIVPADGNMKLYPRKVWRKLPGATMDDVRKAFLAVTIDTRQVELMNIIQFSLDMADRLTGFDLIMQGQASAAPETATSSILKTQASGSMLRRIARTFDDFFEPHVKRYYDYLMADPDVPDDEKGDYCVVVHASSSLVERAIHDQTIIQLTQIAANPASGLDFELWTKELMKSQRMNYNAMKISDDKKAQMQQAQQPADPRTDAANIRAQTDMQKAQLVQQSDMAELQFKAQEAEKQRQHDMAMKNVELQLKTMEMKLKRSIEIDKLRTDLANNQLDQSMKEKLFTAEALIKAQEGSGI